MRFLRFLPVVGEAERIAYNDWMPRLRWTRKLDSGTLVIVAILTAALTAAGFAWWYQYQQNRRAVTFWGVESASLISRAPHVELWKFRDEELPSLNESATPRFGTLPIVRQLDISDAAGLIHARQALISDASFEWGEPATSPSRWDYALHFRDGDQALIVAFDLSQGIAARPDQGDAVRMGPTLTKGLRTFFAEQWTRHAADEADANSAGGR